MPGALLAARLVLAVVFGVAGVAKLFDVRGAIAGASGFGLPEKLAKLVGPALPVVELGIAVAVVPLSTAWWGALAALCVLVAFVAAIARSMRHGQAPKCHCFGQLHSAPAGPGALVRNAALAAVAAFVVAHGPGSSGTSATAWVSRLSTSELLAVIAIVISAALAVAAATLSVSLLRAHGRLLVRVDELQSALAGAGVGAHVPVPATNNGHRIPGLPVFSRAPEFDLALLGGGRTTSRELLGRGLPLLLVFTDPGCGPCKEAVSLVALWQRNYAERVTIAVLSQGDRDLMRARTEQLDPLSVLLDEDGGVARAYASYGTPSSVLVSTEGRVASPVSSGPKGVHDVLERALGVRVPLPEQEQRSVSALASTVIGSQVPEFELPTVAGGSLSTQSLSGGRTVMLFWNQNCGFCAKMKPDLQAWWTERAAGVPQLLIISRGSAEENKDLGQPERVVLDHDLVLARHFGATGTPMGVLVADGRVSSGVAAGADAVFALLGATRNEKVAGLRG
jgi:peroxiredoxin